MKEVQVNSSHSGQELSKKKKKKKAIMISPSPFPHSKCSVSLSPMNQYVRLECPSLCLALPALSR